MVNRFLSLLMMVILAYGVWMMMVMAPMIKGTINEIENRHYKIQKIMEGAR